jgi:hypothetical protein
MLIAPCRCILEPAYMHYFRIRSSHYLLLLQVEYFITDLLILYDWFPLNLMLTWCILFRVVFWDILLCKIIVDQRQYIPEDNSDHTCRHENFKSHMVYFILI